MTIQATLQDLGVKAAQSDLLISEAHALGPEGHPVMSPLSQQQVTVAAFLNLFVAWETFLEDVIAKLMTGAPTISGTLPTCFASPPSAAAARAMVIGMNKYFDYANYELLKKLVLIYFRNGYPFLPHLDAASTDLQDLRAMRNASAHVSSTTQAALNAVAQRLLGTPAAGISLYALLTSPDPAAAQAGGTIYARVRDRLLATAHLIATG